MRETRWRLGKLLNRLAAWLQIDRPGASMKREEIDQSFITVETNNTYEAAFYMTKGAYVEKVKFRPVAENKRQKRGYSYAWIMTLANVPKRAHDIYLNGSAQCSVRELEWSRRKLKRTVKNLS